jgi:hypothetical protein
MRYESLLLPKDIELSLKAVLIERLVDLYKLIIDFQVRSVIRFYRSQTKNLGDGAEGKGVRGKPEDAGQRTP